MAAETARVATKCIEAKESGVLDLSGCLLTTLPDAIFFMLSSGESITKCDLSNNNLKIITSKIPKHFDQMTEFRCASNKAILKLPEEFSQLEKLKIVDISGNKFTSIPNLCPTLERLNVSNNEITHLSNDDIEKLNQVKEIDLRGNDLDEKTKLLLSEHANFIL